MPEITFDSFVRYLPLVLGAGVVFGLFVAITNLAAKPRQVQSEQTGEQATISSFIEGNHKLITTLGVFTALTVYSGNLPLKPVGYVLSFFFLAAAVLLWFELQSKFPKFGTSSLGWFENVLLYATMILIGYWLLEFRPIWRYFLFLPIGLLILWPLTIVVKRYDLFNSVFRSQPGERKLLRYIFAEVLFFTSVFLGLVISIVIAQPVNDFLDGFAKYLQSLSY